MPARRALPDGNVREGAVREGSPPPRPSHPSLGSRLAWFVGLWVASVAMLGTVGYAIKLWLGA